MKKFIRNIICNKISDNNEIAKPTICNVDKHEELILLLNDICDNQDFTEIQIKYGNTKIKLNKDKNNIALTVHIIDNIDTYNLMNNLPVNIDELIINLYLINLDSITHYKNDYLEKLFTNLPCSLKKIRFMYPLNYEQYLSKKYPYFNILFNIKIPLNCVFCICFDNSCYVITDIDSLTLQLTKGDIIHTINYVVKEIPKGRGGCGGGMMKLVVYGAEDVYL